MRQGRGQRARRSDLIDARQLRGERLQAGPFDRGFVHDAGVEVADLARLGIAGVSGGRFDLALLGEHLVNHHGVDPPAGSVGRDRRVAQPGAVSVAEQVVLRANRAIHVLDLQSGRQHRRRGRPMAQADCEDSRYRGN